MDRVVLLTLIVFQTDRSSIKGNKVIRQRVQKFLSFYIENTLES